MDRLERLVNLVAALIDTRQPLTREQIHQRIEGYSDDPDAFRRNFERDKELLRQMGLPLATEPLDPTTRTSVGYRIPREEYELPDPGLDEHELAALRLASAAVQVDGAWGRDASRPRALRKLGGAATGPPAADRRRGEATPVGPGWPACRAATRWRRPSGPSPSRRRVRFTYRGEARVVDPWRLSFRRGQWYLAGLDHAPGRGAPLPPRPDARARWPWRVRRARSPGRPGGAPGPPPPWRLGDDEEVMAELLVDADQARWAIDALGEEAVVERRPDGSVVFQVGVTNSPAFRSFVLGFLDHAEILGPPELRRTWSPGCAAPGRSPPSWHARPWLGAFGRGPAGPAAGHRALGRGPRRPGGGRGVPPLRGGGEGAARRPRSCCSCAASTPSRPTC